MESALFFGDNLEVLRRHVPDGSVDLVYLDPPFNSDQNYNVLFHERNGAASAAQIKAFDDTWQWDTEAAAAYQETIEAGGQIAVALRALRSFLGTSDMMAYLAMMAPRLIELRRVLKETGTLYLHCDRTASHYLKILLDGVFGPRFFLNEITWKRTHSHGNVGRNFGSICDSLLVYTKSERYCWNQLYLPFSADYVKRIFKYSDADGRRWQSVTLRNPGVRPNLRFPYTASNGVTYKPHRNGWSCDAARLAQYDAEGRLHFPEKADGALRLKMYLDESRGVRVQNLWTDIPPLGAVAAERLGYPTQKPEALLARIIEASSNPGDVVMDPFCGCGTAIAAAQKLDRRWIGIDITHLAIGLIKSRLAEAFDLRAKRDYSSTGEPASVPDAAQLALEDPYQFQCWCLGLVGARPAIVTRGADAGIDGRKIFIEREGVEQEAILSVKSGRLALSYVRDLRGVIERENAAIGVLLTLAEPTPKMKAEAAVAGFYSSPWGRHRRLQTLTVAELLAGKTIDCPSGAGLDRTLKAAQHYRRTPAQQLELPAFPPASARPKARRGTKGA